MKTNFGGRLPKTETGRLVLSVASSMQHLDGLIENLAYLLVVAWQPTLAFLLLVAIVTNSTGVVSESLPTVEESCVCMGVFNLQLPSNNDLQSYASFQHFYHP
jgi:hypothetical protein